MVLTPCLLALQNHLLWVQVFALILSASGVRRYLDDSTPQYVAELGWIDGVLTWFSSASIPVTLFSTGAWICGKQLISRRNIKKVGKAFPPGAGLHASLVSVCC
jgi:predicted permease